MCSQEMDALQADIDCTSLVLLYDQQKKIIITSRHCPAQLGPGEGFTGRRFIGRQGIYRGKRRRNLSGGEGSGVASNANVSVCIRVQSKRGNVWGVLMFPKY